MTFKDQSQYVFLPDASKPQQNRYVLSRIVNIAQRYITIHRGNSGQVTSITNDNGAGDTLLSFNYNSALATIIQDVPGGREVQVCVRGGRRRAAN